MSREEEKENKGKKQRLLWDTASIGIYIALCVIIGLLGGRWIDGKLDTEPLFLFIGFFFGLAAAGIEVWRVVKRISSQ
ncbi:MAG: AtpZ/AtpI family protein [Pseudomonadota bacterium]